MYFLNYASMHSCSKFMVPCSEIILPHKFRNSVTYMHTALLQDVLIDLGARLGLPGFINNDFTPKYPDGYIDYIINHERQPGIGPLAGWRGNGGICVRIRHNSSYTTGYGHMSKIATKTGRRVRQGQIIGYVGNTGMSTGPHLHYTVSHNGKFINSQKLKLPSGKILSGEERKQFEIKRIKLEVSLGELLSRL